MKATDKYSIPFVGLKVGHHSFQYHIDREFFQHFPDSPVQQSNVEVYLDFEKKNNFFVLDFSIEGIVPTECDRCLEIFDIGINGRYRVLAKYSDDAAASDDNIDVVYIANQDISINVAQLIYEFVILSIPVRRVHPDTAEGKMGCDATIIQHLQKNEQKNTVPSSDNETDPRWQSLLALKQQNNKQ